MDMEPVQSLTRQRSRLYAAGAVLQDHRQHGIVHLMLIPDSPSDTGNGGAIYILGLEMTPEERSSIYLR